MQELSKASGLAQWSLSEDRHQHHHTSHSPVPSLQPPSNPLQSHATSPPSNNNTVPLFPHPQAVDSPYFSASHSTTEVVHPRPISRQLLAPGSSVNRPHLSSTVPYLSTTASQSSHTFPHLEGLVNPLQLIPPSIYKGRPHTPSMLPFWTNNHDKPQSPVQSLAHQHLSPPSGINKPTLDQNSAPTSHTAPARHLLQQQQQHKPAHVPLASSVAAADSRAAERRRFLEELRRADDAAAVR